MPDNETPAERTGTGVAIARRATRAIAWVFGAASVALVLWVVVGRFIQPAECEWMASAVRDGVDRVKAGEQLYAAPSGTFIAYIYPPLYFWLSAVVAKVTGTMTACRLVSIAATVLAMVSIAKIARSLGATKEWTVFAVVLYFGAYSYTLFFYDLERVDALEAGIASAGVAVLFGAAKDRRAELVRAAASGALLGLSYFAKQPGLFVFVAVLAGLFAAREWRRLVAFAAAGVVTAGALFFYAQTASHGWFSYYVMKLPSAHGIRPGLISLFWLVDAPKAFALTGASVGLIAAPLFRLAKRAPQRWQDVTFASVLGAAMLGAFLLRAHVGGFINVLMCWTPFGCAAVAVAASRTSAAFDEPRTRAAAEIGLFGVVALQLATWMFDPNEIAPSSLDVRADAELVRIVKTFEKEGEVIVSTTGNVTTPRHFHSAALYDVIRAGDPMPADYLDALRGRKYAAMLVGAPNETECKPKTCSDVSVAVLENYFVAGRLRTPLRTSFVGFDARPGWIMRPRKTPLTGLSLEALNTRSRVEAALADMRTQALGEDADLARYHDDIEQLAADAELTRAKP